MSTCKNSSTSVSPATSNSLDRRKFLGASALAMAGLALARASAQDIEKVTQAQHDKSISDPGPENKSLSDISPNGFVPPPTDHGEAPEFWNSFSVAHRRIQPGGWTRQVTVEDFPISKDIAGLGLVNENDLKNDLDLYYGLIEELLRADTAPERSNATFLSARSRIRSRVLKLENPPGKTSAPPTWR